MNYLEFNIHEKTKIGENFLPTETKIQKFFSVVERFYIQYLFGNK